MQRSVSEAFDQPGAVRVDAVQGGGRRVLSWRLRSNVEVPGKRARSRVELTTDTVPVAVEYGKPLGSSADGAQRDRARIAIRARPGR